MLNEPTKTKRIGNGGGEVVRSGGCVSRVVIPLRHIHIYTVSCLMFRSKTGEATHARDDKGPRTVTCFRQVANLTYMYKTATVINLSNEFWKRRTSRGKGRT